VWASKLIYTTPTNTFNTFLQVLTLKFLITCFLRTKNPKLKPENKRGKSQLFVFLKLSYIIHRLSFVLYNRITEHAVYGKRIPKGLLLYLVSSLTYIEVKLSIRVLNFVQ